MKRFIVVAVILSIGLGLCLVAQACNVPVFRYALERWNSDPYRVVLFHRGALTAAERETLAPLYDQQDKSLANLTFRAVDVSKWSDDSDEHKADRELLAAQADSSLPRLILQYPEPLRNGAVVWAGPLEREAVAGLTQSPLRSELVRRLADGQTAVWLLLECGEKEKDDAAAALIQAELTKLSAELKLPELTDAPSDELLSAKPLEIAFSVQRVSRSDANEAALTGMLVHSESDLAERSDPMVFPVFGRGRALLPLVGAGITAENVHDSAAFLVGACSCEVKELNPGFDLLLAAEWDKLLSEEGVPFVSVARSEVETKGPAQLIPIPAGSKPTTVTVPAPVVVVNYSSPSMMMTPVTWIVAGALVSLLLVVVVVVAISGNFAASSPRDH